MRGPALALFLVCAFVPRADALRPEIASDGGSPGRSSASPYEAPAVVEPARAPLESAAPIPAAADPAPQHTPPAEPGLQILWAPAIAAAAFLAMFLWARHFPG